MTLGQKIKKLRTDKGLTQKDLADQVYVTFQTVSKWEKDENEPDVSTLRQLAKLFDCSVDYLINEDEAESKEETKEEPVAVPKEVVTKTIVVHQRELHVCERCKKDIPEDDLAMMDICTRHADRGHSAEYRKAYFHKHCFDEINKERAEAARKAREDHKIHARRRCFGWGIAAGVIGFGVALAIFLCNTQYVNPGLGVLFSVLIGYGLFAALYCILSGSYIGEVFVWCAGLSIKFPGIIFSLDIESVIWAISMKILFAILGVLASAFALALAVAMSAALGGLSFPFILIHNNHTDYEDAF